MRIYFQYLLCLLAIVFKTLPSFGQLGVLVVGGGTDADPRVFDQSMVDSLTQWGFPATYINEATYQNSSFEVYDGMVGVFFSETVNSSGVSRFGPASDGSGDNFPLHYIVMEPSAPAKSPADGGWGIPIVVAASNGNEGDLSIEILNNTHYITSEYEEGELITYSSRDSYNVTGALYELEAGYFDDILATLSSSAMSGIPTPAEAQSDHFLLATKDASNSNPSRSFFWSVTSGNLDGEAVSSSESPTLATEAFYSLMHRGAIWTYDNASAGEQVFTSILDVEDPVSKYNLRAYNDFREDRLVVGFHMSEPENVKVTLINLSGQEVEVLKDGPTVQGNNFVGLHESQYSAGIYLVKLEVENGITDVVKVSVH